MKLGARYGSSGWYAPPGVDLSAFGERGWLTEAPPESRRHIFCFGGAGPANREPF